MATKSFRGGVHPREYKELTEHIAFEVMPAPQEIFVPLNQHLGKEAIALVKKGTAVIVGSVVAEADGFISAPIHSSVCGTVTSIGKQSTPFGFPKDTIVIKTNGQAESNYLPPLSYETITQEEIKERVKAAGIVGQGGAAFPTYVKLTPPKDKKIEFVILNGCECEPYLTRDYRFMVERPEAVIEGLKLLLKAINVEKGYIGIEDNKPDAIKIMTNATAGENNIEVFSLKTKYPQGAEKMLIKAITGREVPPGKLPLEVGAVIQNIGTAVAVYDAVVKGEPSLTAALTVTGLGIKNPKNLLVPVGTPLKDVLDFCGGVTDDAVKTIVGGPMMGVAQHDLMAPVLKATSGIIVLTEKEISKGEETACLKCGQCVSVCPLNLMPTKLVRYSQLGRFEDAEQLGITVCMECGTCAYTCPANIPLVQWLRLGKQRVMQIQRQRAISQN
ncbi:MAG: electron transport complex subunit RsxC [Ignavibacteriaceae bacterium]|nr:electron transport complex subunit RsxC [Ignavibacteriaceae bacterium]